MHSHKKKLVALGVLLLAIFVAATISLGNHIFDSSFALNPQEVLTDDQNFSQLLFADANTLHCPSGFSKIGNECDFNSTERIGGWLIVDFTADTNALVDANTVIVKISELNLGCTDCNNATAVKIFTTPNLDTNNIVWTFQGRCKAQDNEQNVVCEKTFAEASLEGVLVGRWPQDGTMPDPAVHYVKVVHD